jgi:dTDP-4-dehydrorhamnose reductase
MAIIAKKHHIKLIHISTDYVFYGSYHKPFGEEDETNPQSVYGKTKLAGEKAILQIAPPNSIVIRSSWVYSYYGNNFVKTMLRLGEEKQELNVVDDQIGSPTYARDLAEAILHIVRHSTNGTEYPPQVYHYSNEGFCSWYDFAKEIMKSAGLKCRINPLKTSQYPTPAKRPHYSMLDKAKIKKDFTIKVPSWKESLDDCLTKMGAKKI